MHLHVIDYMHELNKTYVKKLVNEFELCQNIKLNYLYNKIIEQNWQIRANIVEILLLVIVIVQT